MALEIGTAAPDFSLAPAPGPDRVSLSDFRGEKAVVLLFMPLAFSSVCTDEMCQMAENYAGWTDLNAQVLGVTIDSPFVTAKFREETQAPFPILSDFNKTTIRDYDVAYDEFFGMNGVAKRSAFIIDRDGVIRYAWSSDDAGVMPPLGEIRERVAELG